MSGSTIVGFGHYVPERRVGNAEIEQRLGLEPGWILRRTGIEERRYAAADEALTDIAAPAAEMALAQSGVDRAARRPHAAGDQHAGSSSAALGAAARPSAGPQQLGRHRPRRGLRRLPLRADVGGRLRTHARCAGACRRRQHPVAPNQFRRAWQQHPVRGRGRCGGPGASGRGRHRRGRRQARGRRQRLRPHQDRGGRQPAPVRARNAHRRHADVDSPMGRPCSPAPSR